MLTYKEFRKKLLTERIFKRKESTEEKNDLRYISAGSGDSGS